MLSPTHHNHLQCSSHHYDNECLHLWQQPLVTTPPATIYAQTTFGTHEIKTTICFILSLLLCKRYIDDIIGVWVPRDDPTADDVEWKVFKMFLNMWFGLEWTVIESNNTVDFMDLTITLKDEKITTTLFEKSLHLYLYIPPQSAHLP
eukprot:4091592-Ditylum_brightwellii.AAC.1